MLITLKENLAAVLKIVINSGWQLKRKNSQLKIRFLEVDGLLQNRKFAAVTNVKTFTLFTIQNNLITHH